jgi:GTP-binding protein
LARFMTSAMDASHFPAPMLPEVAFLGRSNVGKSSVINSLLGAKVAKTSSTPGRTRSINFFELRWAGKPRPELIFTDLPGYGYAKISREISSHWPSFIEPYLERRASLALCLVLVDVNVPPQESDRLGEPTAQLSADLCPGISSSPDSSFLRQKYRRARRAMEGDSGCS